MVSPIWLSIAGSLGLLAYLGIPFVAGSFPIEYRQKVGRVYLKMAARSYKQFTFVRRVLSGYDVIPIDVDAEQKLLKVTLSSSVVGSDKEFQFNDPDNRIKRLFNKPVAIAFEQIPAAVDAELAELGYWVREKSMNEGLISGDINGPPEDVTVDPYVRMSDSLRLIDPVDAYEIVPNAVEPENIKTCEQLTKERFSQYGSRIGLTETVGTIMGFAVGIGAVAGLRYLNQNLIDGGGGGGGGVSNPLGSVDLGGAALLPVDGVSALVHLVLANVHVVGWLA